MYVRNGKNWGLCFVSSCFMFVGDGVCTTSVIPYSFSEISHSVFSCFLSFLYGIGYTIL